MNQHQLTLLSWWVMLGGLVMALTQKVWPEYFVRTDGLRPTDRNCPLSFLVLLVAWPAVLVCTIAVCLMFRRSK